MKAKTKLMHDSFNSYPDASLEVSHDQVHFFVVKVDDLNGFELELPDKALLLAATSISENQGPTLQYEFHNGSVKIRGNNNEVELVVKDRRVTVSTPHLKRIISDLYELYAEKT